MSRLNDIVKNYYPGEKCLCAARHEGECGCDANWDSKLEIIVKYWSEMPASEMRLHCGEMTNQEVRTVKAVLKNILEMSKNN